MSLNADHARRTIAEHTRRLAESAAAAGPDAAVPTTPKWTITDLVGHVGQVQHWTAEIIERRVTDPARLPPEWSDEPVWTGQLRADRARRGGWAPCVGLARALEELRQGLTART